MGKHKPDVRFIVHTDRDRAIGYAHVRLEIGVVINDKGEVHSPGFFYHDDPDYSTNELRDLTVSAQASTGEDSDDAQRWYAWEVAYRQPLAVTLADAQTMARVLGRVDREMRKLAARFGAPESFPAYALQVAYVLGAHADSVFGWHEPDGYGPDGWTWLGAEGLRWRLRELLKDS